MNWRYKAFLQAVLSTVPAGTQLNYLFRRYVTKTVPASSSVQVADYSFAVQHLSAFRACGLVPIEDAQFYEFGVGWDLMIPLSFYSLGVNRQIVTDLRRLLKASLVADATAGFHRPELHPAPLRLPRLLSGSVGGSDLDRLLKEYYGIDYRAPFDACRTGFAAESVDYITATTVLSHISVSILREIFQECHRILRPGGIISILSSYRDEYCRFDRSISAYNFLRYADRTWENFYNPTLNYQNRLRHIDYRQLFSEAGFEIVRDVAGYDGTMEAARELLARLPLAERFRKYALDDIAPVRGVFVLRKKPEAPTRDDYR